MKYLFLLLITTITYSQTNRYSEVTPSTYSNTTSTNNTVVIIQQPNPIDIYGSYYQKQSDNKNKYIQNEIRNYKEAIEVIMNDKNADYILKSDLVEITKTINYLLENPMSFEEAENYLKRINKNMKNAIAEYKKRRN